MYCEGKDALKTTSLWLLVLSALFWATPQFAQDSVSNTPPELKGFRLDPENKPTEPKPSQPKSGPPEIMVPPITPAAKLPEAAQPVREPDTAPTDSPAPKQPVVAVPQQVSEKATAPTPTSAQTSNEPQGVPVASPVEPPATPEPNSSTQATQAPSPIAEPDTPNPMPRIPWTEIAAAALAMALAGLAYLFFRRRSSEVEADEDHAQVFADTSNAAIEELPKSTSAPMPAIRIEKAPKAIKPPKPAARPMLDVSFIPAKATISFNSLTIKGELRIINQSKCPAKTMRLRAAIISASEIQNAVIKGFHNDPAQGTVEELGPAAADERVAMQIELTIPLSDLKTYPLGDQQLFVPIILANVYYEWQGKAAHDEARITCMVGREANPPQPKMGPFRLDLGPRSFASLGQRPIFA